MAEYKSKTVVVPASSMTVFNRITDLQGIYSTIPEDKRKDVTIDGDTVNITYAGFTLGIRMAVKDPFNRVVLEGVGAPFEFSISILLSPTDDIMRTELAIVVEADLNFMMKAMLGPKIKEGLDQVVDAIASGRMM